MYVLSSSFISLKVFFLLSFYFTNLCRVGENAITVTTMAVSTMSTATKLRYNMLNNEKAEYVYFF